MALPRSPGHQEIRPLLRRQFRQPVRISFAEEDVFVHHQHDIGALVVSQQDPFVPALGQSAVHAIAAVHHVGTLGQPLHFLDFRRELGVQEQVKHHLVPAAGEGRRDQFRRRAGQVVADGDESDVHEWTAYAASLRRQNSRFNAVRD